VFGEPAEAGDGRERLRLDLLATEIAFQRAGDIFLTDGGEDRLRGLAAKLYAAGDQAHAARAWTLLGKAAWVRTDRSAALTCLDRAVELFDELPDTPEKADAYNELSRLHVLNYEHQPAVAAATVAADIAGRLGLVEVAANARVTIGLAHYEAGDRGGIVELEAAVDQCRNQRLLALRRGLQNLAYVLQEEGDYARADALHAERAINLSGDNSLATGYSLEGMRAYVAGEFDKLLAAAEADLATPSGDWDLQLHGICAWVTILRQERDGCADPDDIERILATGRRSGFYRLEWTALGHVAFCRALQGRHDDATTILGELVDSWERVRVVTFGEWLDTAAHAAAVAGRIPSLRLREMLADVPHRTPWVEAAARTVAAGVAEADGDHARAAELHLAAAEQYADLPHVSDRILALAAAARCQRRLDAGVTEPVRVELTEFAARNDAPGLLTLAGLEVAV
jgi:tetratricopeptide (TPR) repeat protein